MVSSNAGSFTPVDAHEGLSLYRGTESDHVPGSFRRELVLEDLIGEPRIRYARAPREGQRFGRADHPESLIDLGIHPGDEE